MALKENMFVIQNCDGAAVMVEEINDLQSRVRQKYSDALFAHCCAQRHNLILSQIMCNSNECKIFLRQ
jgi:hypothetical protein